MGVEITILILASSLFFFLPQCFDSFGIPKLFLSGFFCFVAVLVGWRRKKSPLDIPILLFIISIVISWLFSADKSLGILGLYTQPFYALAIVFQCLIVYSIGIKTKTLARFCAIGLIIEAIVCILNLKGIPAWGMTSFRAVGTMGAPVFLAAWASCAGPMCLKSFKFRGWGLAGWVFIAFATGSRGMAVASLLGLLIAFKPKYALYSLLLVPLFFLVPGKRVSDTMRFHTWSIAVRAGLEHPLVGWGPGTFILANQKMKTKNDIDAFEEPSSNQASAHNDILEVWATLGGLGLIAYIYLQYTICKLASRGDPFVYASLIALFIQAKVNPIPNAAMLLGAAILSCV